MKTSILFWLIYFASTCVAETPNQCILKYSAFSTQLNSFEIIKLGYRDFTDYNKNFSAPLNKQKTGTLTIENFKEGLYRIADAMDGHVIYLENGDSVSIVLKEIANIGAMQKKGEYFRYFNTMSVTGNHAWHYLFFDEFYARTKSLRTFKLTYLSTPLFYKNNCDKLLDIGNNLLDSLFNEHLISKNFKEIASKEINAIYVAQMCAVISRKLKSQIPKPFFKRLNNMSFTNNFFAEKCGDYLQAGALYNYYIYNNYNPQQRFGNLKNEFETILKNYDGIIRDKLMAWQIEDYIGSNHPDFNKCYLEFIKICQSDVLKKTVRIKMASYVKKSVTSKKYTLDFTIKNTTLSTAEQKIIGLKDILQDTIPVLLDCWATWCSPCLQQMPFLDTIKEMYKGKIKFVKIYFDQDLQRWIDFEKRSKNKLDSYHMFLDFSGVFCQFFKIKEIPRFMLFKKGGEGIWSDELPMPADRTGFCAYLDRAIE